MAKQTIPNDITDAWLYPMLTQPEVRRDLTKYLRASKKGDMLTAAELLGRFDGPSLVVWATEDRVMALKHGQRLAKILPHGQLIEVADSYTLIPEDQPDVLAQAIRQFIQNTA